MTEVYDKFTTVPPLVASPAPPVAPPAPSVAPPLPSVAPPLPSVAPPPPDILPGIPVDDGTVAALIGGVTGALLLALICFIAVLLWCLSRQKGSYVTNELDDDDDDVENEDEGSVASDTALQSKEPLRSQEED